MSGTVVSATTALAWASDLLLAFVRFVFHFFSFFNRSWCSFRAFFTSRARSPRQ
jgi:hypothetical protein